MGHVVGKGAHGLQALDVASGFAFGAAKEDIPILGGDDGHIAHLEGHLQGLKRCRAAAATTHAHHGRGLAVEDAFTGEEHTLLIGQQSAGRLPVVDGATQHYGVAPGHLVDNPVAHVAVEGAATKVLAATHAAVYAAARGFIANPEDFRVDALPAEPVGHFAEGYMGVALLVGTSIH